MTSMTAQIDLLRKNNRKQKIEKFEQFLVKHYGRKLKTGDVIIHKFIEPIQFNKVEWGYSHPELTAYALLDKTLMDFCDHDTEQSSYTMTTFTKANIKQSRLARADELNGSAFQFTVIHNTTVVTSNTISNHDTFRSAAIKMGKIAADWVKKGPGRSIKKDGFVPGYITTDTNATDDEPYTSFAIKRTRRPEHPY